MDSAHSHQTPHVNSSCPLCQLVQKGPSHPDFLLEMSHVVVSRGPFSERWPGALQVTSKRHLRDPSQLKYPHFIHTQAELFSLESAIRAAVRPHHMNVVKFGNVVEHLHWHLIPRFSTETHPQKTPWELSDVPSAGLFHTSFSQPRDEIFADIVAALPELLKNRQPPCFATAFFMRPRAQAARTAFFEMPLSAQHNAICASPSDFECFLMQRNYLDFAWDTFGGELDASETPAQALVREIREELGWDVLNKLEVTRQWNNGMLRGFVYLTIPTGNLLLQEIPQRAFCDEVKQAAWHPLDALLNNSKNEYSRPLAGRARALVASHPDFSL